ncbi:MAG: serine/threonine protein kinase [Deltaproteobacteria bacterium]|nr:serine/threonine protein kinase [Deltaproteobacteria bacterium]
MTHADAANEGCLSPDLLLDVAEGRGALSPEARAHLGECGPCCSAFAALVRTAPGDEARSIFEGLREGDCVNGRFRLRERLGAGGAGEVWEASDERTGSTVAVKLLRHVGGTPARRQRREAIIAMTLAHPAIGQVLELVDDEIGRGPILVMPRYRGEGLDAKLAREGRLDVPEVARVVVPVLDALAFAHARGVVHRDIKPANIFLSHDGVRVLDFGLAKLLEDAAIDGSRITRTGDVLGTPRFMAPEQLFGARDIDARADLWSVGAVVYTLLAGVSPLAATTLGETMRAHARGELAPIATHRGDLPERLSEAIMHALAPDRERRAATVAELRGALVIAARLRPSPP